MAFQTTSPLTAALSSAHHSRLNSLSAWALYTTSPPPTALRPTAWWRGVFDSSKALRARTTGANWPSHLPWVILGLRAAPKPPPRRIHASPQLSSSTVFLWYFLASFLVSRSRRQRCSASLQGLHLPTSPPGVPATPRSPKRSLSSSRVLHLFMFATAVPNRHSPAYRGPFAAP